MKAKFSGKSIFWCISLLISGGILLIVLGVEIVWAFFAAIFAALFSGIDGFSISGAIAALFMPFFLPVNESIQIPAGVFLIPVVIYFIISIICFKKSRKADKLRVGFPPSVPKFNNMNQPMNNQWNQNQPMNNQWNQSNQNQWNNQHQNQWGNSNSQNQWNNTNNSGNWNGQNNGW